MARRKNRKPSPAQQTVIQKTGNSLLARLLALFAGSGILVALLGIAYQFFAGNISLEFVQAIGRAYEFQLKNDTPSDRTVKFFRIDPPSVQQVVYKVTEDVYANIDAQGHVSLPGGNVSYIPAAEFKELDGQRLLANSTLKFRVPPLSSRTWMAPEATIVDVHYELESSNLLLSAIEELLNVTGIRSRVRSIRYLVIDNYWTISRSASIDEAIRVFCRDNEAIAKSSTCAPVRY
ncbi:MAG: hypothetical protein RBT64_01230 [Trichloromonas sp.]|jgi:hypothetical protein|nr:hypothetical protein [Trichloromonas sp.]